MGVRKLTSFNCPFYAQWELLLYSVTVTMSTMTWHSLAASSVALREWKRPIVITALLLGAFAIVDASLFLQTPFVSSEVRFADASPGGFLIVPASCPSSPSNSDYPHNTCSATCPNGLNINQYPSCTCPGGQVQSGSQCVCPSGQTWNGSQCIATSGGCTAQYFCASGASCTGSGDTLCYRNAACSASVIFNPCQFGCSGGACNGAPAPVIDITVNPSLIRRGETTHVIWNASFVSSCTVTEDNSSVSDAWSCSTQSSCAASHDNLSSALSERTTYVLSCTGLNGSQVTDSAILNIIPIFQET